MASGSVALSEFEFLTYRITTMELHVRPLFDMGITNVGDINSVKWNVALGFADITKQNDLYAVPLSAEMKLIQAGSWEENLSDPYLTAMAVIVGFFRFKEINTFTEELKDRLLRCQCPTILFPYLRSTMSLMLQGAGFGASVMPLFNVAKMAEERPPVNIVESVEDK